MEQQRVALSGWGRTSPSTATVVDATPDELTAPGALAGLAAHGRGAIVRGCGRAYGDAAQNGGGTVLRLRATGGGSAGDAVEIVDGRITVSAAVTFDALLRELVPQGWFVPVTPGTRFITVGGAVASDIHGKNHHVDGSFGRFVEQLQLLLADGTTRSIGPDTDPELFFATLGGMGLTGVITAVTFRLLPIETSRCLVHTERVPDLDSLLTRMEDGDDRYRYSVAWVDLVATGRRLGRSVLTRGDHATLEQLAEVAPRQGDDPLAFDPPALPDVPPLLPNVLSRTAVHAFNELWFRKAPADHVGIESLTGFFHPLDMVGHWNRLYGPRGFLQYQFVVPFDAEETVRAIVTRVAGSGHASFLAVLKRFGAGSGALLGFPMPGWTLSLDVPAGAPGLGPLLAELDAQVIGAGGRHYLAKDAHTTPDVIRAGYPRLDDWKRIRRRVDPDGVWISDLARRLDLT